MACRRCIGCGSSRRRTSGSRCRDSADRLELVEGDETALSVDHDADGIQAELWTVRMFRVGGEPLGRDNAHSPQLARRDRTLLPA